jgi:hypothetical protein
MASAGIGRDVDDERWYHPIGAGLVIGIGFGCLFVVGIAIAGGVLGFAVGLAQAIHDFCVDERGWVIPTLIVGSLMGLFWTYGRDDLDPWLRRHGALSLQIAVVSMVIAVGGGIVLGLFVRVVIAVSGVGHAY